MTYPKAIMFVPCERLSLDQITGKTILWMVHDTIQPFPFTATEEMLSGAIVENVDLLRQAKFLLPEMATLTVWTRGQADAEKVFEQIVTITAPDGREIPLTMPVHFSFGGSQGHRVLQITIPTTGRLFGFSTLSVKVRTFGEEEWHTATTYPLYVEEVTQPPQVPVPQNPEA